MPTPPEPTTDLDHLAEMLEQQYRQAITVEPRVKRLRRAIRDLGLPVPTDWVDHTDPDVVRFGHLTAAQFDHLVQLLEDVAANRPVLVSIQRGGPNLFDGGAPSGPITVNAPHASSIHITVPQ